MANRIHKRNTIAAALTAALTLVLSPLAILPQANAAEGTETVVITVKDSKTLENVGGTIWSLKNDETGESIRVGDNYVVDKNKDDGVIELEKIVPGAYTLSVSYIPQGWKWHSDVRINVADTSANDLGVASVTEILLAADPFGRPGIVFHKSDSDTKYLIGGSEWKLEANDGSERTYTLVDDGENDLLAPVPGQLGIFDIPAGEYTLTETKAPEGYALDSEPKTVRAFIQNLREHPAPTFFNKKLPNVPEPLPEPEAKPEPKPEPKSEPKSEPTPTAKNEQPKELAKTGETSSLPLVGVAAVVLILGGATVAAGRRVRREA